MNKKIGLIIGAALLAAPLIGIAVGVIDTALVTRLKGRILLQVQQHGEAWYLDPVSVKRYYMKDGPTAYQMLRQFGLGITDADLAKIPVGQIDADTSTWQAYSNSKYKYSIKLPQQWVMQLASYAPSPEPITNNGEDLVTFYSSQDETGASVTVWTGTTMLSGCNNVATSNRTIDGVIFKQCSPAADKISFIGASGGYQFEIDFQSVDSSMLESIVSTFKFTT